MIELSKDPIANYVVGKAIEVSEGEQQEKFCELISSNRSELVSMRPLSPFSIAFNKSLHILTLLYWFTFLFFNSPTLPMQNTFFSVLANSATSLKLCVVCVQPQESQIS